MSSSTVAATTTLLLLLLIHTPTATSNTAFFSCSPRSTYTSNGNYSRVLLNLLSSLIHTSPSTGFANTTAGTHPPDIIYGLALCRGDLNSSTCSTCLTMAAIDVVNQCPGSLSGAVWYDRCRLRYSDARFFSTLTPDPDRPYFFNERLFRDPRLFRSRFEELARDLQRRAASGNGTGLYASGSIELSGTTDRLYGMVQCTRDLDGELCSRCLEEPIRQISCCGSNVEMTYQGGSCYLRYASYLFFNESVVSPPVAGPPTAGNVSTEQPGLFTLKPGEKKKHRYLAIIALVVGVAILALLLLIAYRASKKKKPRHVILGKSLQSQEKPGFQFNRGLSSKKMSFLKTPQSPSSRSLAIQKLDVPTLKMATDGFSESKHIGRGEFGVVYKGDLPGQEFVVKRFTAKPTVELAVLQREFRTFSKLQHPNIVQLLAFHIEKDGGDKLVVYEHLPNTSLDKILFDSAAGKFPSNGTFNKLSPSLNKHTHNRSRPPRYPDADNRRRLLLDWGRRFRIIQGVAQGLLHLHGEGGLNIIHGNLKASNVLLDKQMEPKISDFCLPRLFEASSRSQEQDKKSSSFSGYMSPESVNGTIATAKTDVFSYGVLVLEIVTGQKNRDLLGTENSTNLLSYVWQYYKDEKTLQVLDWSLGELYKGHEVLRCIHVGLLCVQEDPEKRPNMASIVHMLNSFSFTLPSPMPPAVPRSKMLNGNGNGNPASWDLKLYNQGSGPLSPTSNPSGWADAKLESR